MSFKLFFEKKLIFVLLLPFFSMPVMGIQNYSLSEVSKVLNAIETIERSRGDRDKNTLESMMLTENELNSYIAYRIEKNEEKFMKELRIKLFKGRKIEGRISIELEGQRIPKFLRPQMTLYFGGKIEVRNSQIRLVLKDLFLENQRIEPKILDFIIALVARIEDYEVWSINDWFELPYGIKDVKTQTRKAVFFY